MLAPTAFDSQRPCGRGLGHANQGILKDLVIAELYLERVGRPRLHGYVAIDDDCGCRCHEQAGVILRPNIRIGICPGTGVITRGADDPAAIPPLRQIMSDRDHISRLHAQGIQRSPE